MKKKCPFCGFENIAGEDICENCKRNLDQEDLPKPGKDKLQKIIMTEPVKSFLSKVLPIYVKRSASLDEVIQKMQNSPSKGCVLVCDDSGALVGIASIRDILLKVAGKIQDRKNVSVEKIMTPNPECLDKDQTLSYALHKMSIGKFRHVPVLDNGKPIGVVSTRDIIQYVSKKSGN